MDISQSLKNADASFVRNAVAGMNLSADCCRHHREVSGASTSNKSLVSVVCLLCDSRNGSVIAVFEMVVVSEYVSEYCIWLALRNGLAEAEQLPFSIVDINTTGIAVSGRPTYLLYTCLTSLL